MAVFEHKKKQRRRVFGPGVSGRTVLAKKKKKRDGKGE
jgi:hypothetical protein